MVFSTFSDDKRLRFMNKRLKKLLTKDSDLKFILIDDQNKEVPAHMEKITSISVELKRMVIGLDSNNPPLTVIKVDGILSDDFIEILRYIYEGGANINDDNVYAIIIKSNYFNIAGLEKKCTEFIGNHLNADNVCMTYSYFSTYNFNGYQEILKQCEKEIQSYGKHALKTDGFLELPLDALHKILSLDVLRCPEIDLFKLALSWAENECVAVQQIYPCTANKRKVLNGAESLLRFSTLTLAEFRDCLNIDMDFFTLDEIKSIEADINEGKSTQTQRLFCNKKELTWVEVYEKNAKIPPHAVLALFGCGKCSRRHNLYLGRTLVNGKYIPVQIHDSYSGSNASYFYKNKQIEIFHYEILCSSLYYDIGMLSSLNYTIGFPLTNSGNKLRYIYCSKRGVHIKICHTIKPLYFPLCGHIPDVFNVFFPELFDPKDGIPENVIVGGQNEMGVDYLMCRVLYKCCFIPAVVKRGDTVATGVSFEGVFQTTEFMYMSYNRGAKFVQFSPDIVKYAIIGGRNKQNRYLYIGRCRYKNHMVPGSTSVERKILYFAFDGNSRGKFNDFEILVTEQRSMKTMEDLCGPYVV